MHNVFGYGLCLLAGMGIPLLATLNAQLGARLGAGLSVVVLFLVGLSSAAVFYAATPSATPPALGTIPKYLFLGGVLVAFYIITVTTQVPRLGVATAILLVLMGQVVTAVALEHFGVLGATKVPINATRMLGVVLILAGFVLARR